MQNKNIGLLLMVSGILTIIGSFLWINAAGLGGILIAPLFYIVGPGLFLFGIFEQFEHRGQGGGARNAIIVILLIAMIIAGIIVVNLKINEQQDRDRRCDAKYGYNREAPGYLACLNGHD